MRWNIVAAVWCVGLSLGACATPSSNYTPVAREVSAPPIGVVSTARVGDIMVEQGRYQEQDAIKIVDKVKVGGIGTYTFTPGHFIKTGENSSGEYFNVSNIPGSGSVEPAAISDPFLSLLIERDSNSLCAVTVFSVKVCKNGVLIQRIKVPSLTSDAFQQTLIYSGKIGNKINIGYREFSNNTARPAFNNDVEYDLSDSKTIGYKGAVIEIVEVNNQFIKYIVRSNFNAATR
jgi:hypothetical protein